MSCLDFNPRVGVLLLQLGTPDDASPSAVKRYLKEFLWDKRVVDVSRPLWWLILNGIILRTRPERSAALYQRLIEKYGPVLLTYSQSLTQQLQEKFADKVVVRFAMRYGNPALKAVLHDMIHVQHCDRILLLPLYPQYCSATSGSSLQAVYDEIRTMRWMPSVRVVPPYANHGGYTQAVAQLINAALARRARPPQKILLSYHGIPKRYVTLGDPYECQCMDTSDALKELLDFPAADVVHAYQSRFGKEEWLKPYTDESLVELAKSGIKDVLVACPSFTMDCLETLDEIGVESRHLFLKNGGENLELVSCLNDNPLWVEALGRMIENELQGWID